MDRRLSAFSAVPDPAFGGVVVQPARPKPLDASAALAVKMNFLLCILFSRDIKAKREVQSSTSTLYLPRQAARQAVAKIAPMRATDYPRSYRALLPR
jgi:hypothetical protein